MADEVQLLALSLIVNVVAGSVLVPRPARAWLYRAAGIRTESRAIRDGCRFVRCRTTIGARTFVNAQCYFEDVGTITIGADCLLGMQVLIATSDHPLEDGRPAPTARPRPVVVGDGCWIGARALLLPGVTIGEGCVIAAGAVIARDCEANGLYAGVPAVRVRSFGSVTA